MPEYIEFGNASEEQKVFIQTVLNIFNPLLKRHGFQKHRAETGAYSTFVVYRKDNLYLKILGSTFPDDKSYYYGISLGEGNSENIEEYNKNSIPLWMLKGGLSIYSDKFEDYPFPMDDDEIIKNIENAKEELLQYGSSFLQGNLSTFRKVLNQRNELLGF